NGIRILLLVAVFMILMETAIVHLLLARKGYDMIAWILSIISLYSAIQIYSHIKAMKLRPFALHNNKLFIRYGLFGDVIVNTDELDQVELTKKDPVDTNDKRTESLAMVKDIEGHNIALHFTKKQRIEKPFGLSKDCDILLINLDNSEEFVETLNQIK
ncbi:hypothetical protein, partial [Aquimarina sp. BL5]